MSRLDEFELIDVFLEAFRVKPSPFGPGDDAAIVPPTGLAQVVTTDALVEDVHFTRRTFGFWQIGHKALAVNLSDLAAMGARPAWALCALQLSDDVTPKELRELSAGMAALASAHGVSLIGGNVSRGPGLSVTLTVAGHIPRGKRALLRSGARPGHRLYVSGPLGSSSAGFEVLSTADASRSKQWEALVLAQRTPSPHVRWGLEAARFASSAIDVSDGLLQDLAHVCRASGVGVSIESGALPVLEALLLWSESEREVQRHALTGGEDYVLAITVPPRQVTAFERRMESIGLGAFPIGVVTRTRSLLVDGQPWRGRMGHRHF